MTKTTYIYRLLCPDTREVRYVGQAVDWKSRKSLYEQCRGANCRSPLGEWLMELWNQGKRPIFELVSTITSERPDGTFDYAPDAVANGAEQRLIGYYAGTPLGKKLLNVAHNPKRAKKNQKT